MYRVERQGQESVQNERKLKIYRSYGVYGIRGIRYTGIRGKGRTGRTRQPPAYLQDYVCELVDRRNLKGSLQTFEKYTNSIPIKRSCPFTTNKFLESRGSESSVCGEDDYQKA